MADSVSSAGTGKSWEIVVSGAYTGRGISGLGIQVAQYIESQGHPVESFHSSCPDDHNCTTSPSAREFTEFDHTDRGHNTANNPATGTGTVGPSYLSSPADDCISDYGE